jgi:hypothetical protein
MHQGDYFIEPFFALAYFCALQTSFIVFPSCPFPSLLDDFHIIGLASLIPLVFYHFVF